MDQPSPSLDDLEFALPELAAALAAAKSVEDVDAALRQVAALTPRIVEPENFGRRLFTRGLDAGLTRIAQALQMAAAPSTKSNDNVVLVASQFYGTGGHTRVARDIVRSLGEDQKPLIVMTNMGDGSLRYRNLIGTPNLAGNMGARGQMFLSAGGLTERSIELFQMLRAVRPTRIILMCHPFDVTAIVGCWPFRDIVEFVHHADHVPALGADLPWSAHVDLTYACHRTCSAAGLNPVYAGMTSTLTEPPPHHRAPGRLRLATCGDQRKYVAPGQRRWTDWAVAALSIADAEMQHIGAMSDDFQQAVFKALAEAGIDPARYVFVGAARSLPAALVEYGTDVYLCSYPDNGGKANLEAMLAGVPTVIPYDPGIPDLMRFALPLPHYIEVTEPSLLAEAVEAALALGETLGGPDARAARARETARFSDFVAGRPLGAA